MGFNTSMIVLNDALGDIERDPEFGRKVSQAVSKLSLPEEYRSAWGVDVSAGCSVNAATVIETHHADSISIVAFGRNEGIVLAKHLYAYGTESQEIRVLKALADQHGYVLHRKPQPKKR